MKRTSIALTKATGIGQLPDLLEQMAGSRSVERVFARTGLSLTLIEDRQHAIPMAALTALYENAAKEAGDGLFGLRAGSATPSGQWGLWARYAAQAATLEDNIARASSTLSLQMNRGRITLERRKRFAILGYQPATEAFADGPQNLDHTIYPIISQLRIFLGSDWLPSWIETIHKKDAYQSDPENLIPVPWLFERKHVGIAIPIESMAARRRLPKPDVEITRLEVLAEVKQLQPGSPLEAIEATAALLLLDMDLSLASTARALDISTRSLQRELNQSGLSFRALSDRIRFRRASALLLETNTPVGHIAHQTGYSDHAHFSRAFQRWQGITPSQFRKKWGKDRNTYVR